ncbi:MAG TPA: bifunctional hydroxymethylpyrimidine kinase/phosphomethylpyrimidine kinase [Acidobacteriota bacterium]|jgi:hydroxymethylpyrimidine/phosphomethylpyrimidine kinase|nr:bifunctional hydroxymethylpyrimidine kinase/phosphomethylpyrimidine kinase [Acidobacteriota bacterium]
MNRNILVMAGLDPSACAGIIVDLKTLMAWRMYGMGVVTAITAQNTQRVDSVYPVPMETIGSQLESIVGDIEIHSVKIGLMPNAKTIELIAELLKTFKLSNIVVDPIFRSSTGYEFADEKMIQAYKEKLFPMVDVITPNLYEAAVLSGMDVKDITTMKEASQKIHQLGPKNVIITGGHLETRAADVIYDGVRHSVYDAPKIGSNNTRGLGCTFSTIVAVHLAKKLKPIAAIDPAKKYLARAMVHPFKIGTGNGPINHNVAI